MNKHTHVLALLLCSTFLFWSCSKETVEPNFTGSIEGNVQNSSTGAPIASASISTNPGTDAILTGPEGQFTINDIPTGNYTVQAVKDGFESKTVRISVKEDRTASAQILLLNSDESSSNNISAAITNVFNTERNDSSFVEVDYMVKNTSGSSTINNYEVYFKIHTSGASFFQEIMGDTLGSREQTIGSFAKYIRQENADSVTISGVYAPK